MEPSAASLTNPATDKPPPRRRWIPLSLKMFVVLLLLFVAWSIWCIGVPTYRRHVAIREIEQVGGNAISDQGPVGPVWLRDLVGWGWMERNVDDIDTVILADTAADDETLRPIFGLPRVREVWLRDTKVTDSGLQYLRPLAQLERLLLSDSRVTDDGLKAVGELTSLKDLNLCSTRVTDRGLQHLKRLTNLEIIWLYDTPVTDEGADDLQSALPGLRIGRNRGVAR
jgi:hypothetical protein